MENCNSVLEFKLTELERKILIYLAKGLTSKEIAERLNISVDEANINISSIMTKFKVKSEIQAVIFAIMHGII